MTGNPSESGRSTARVFKSLAEAMAAGAVDSRDTGVLALLKKEKELDEAEAILTENASGEALYKVLVIGDQASANELLHENDRLSIAEHRDPTVHSIDDICKHIAEVMNTPKQYDAVVFCHKPADAEPAYLEEFCRDHGLGLSGG
jgi:hypothetical protein